MRMRSPQPATCGDRYAPAPSPAASRCASTVRVAVDFPFVPTTCTDRNDRCGSPSAARSSLIRPSPNSAGQGVSEAIHAVAGPALAKRVELAPIALELRALGVDHVGRRVRHEALVREHPLGAL